MCRFARACDCVIRVCLLACLIVCVCDYLLDRLYVGLFVCGFCVRDCMCVGLLACLFVRMLNCLRYFFVFVRACLVCRFACVRAFAC